MACANRLGPGVQQRGQHPKVGNATIIQGIQGISQIPQRRSICVCVRAVRPRTGMIPERNIGAAVSGGNGIGIVAAGTGGPAERIHFDGSVPLRERSIRGGAGVHCWGGTA